jgi:hypothetical protein
MKCAICEVIGNNVYFRNLRKNNSAQRYESPEACASFNASNGMTVYICYQHLTANMDKLNELVITGKEEEG